MERCCKKEPDLRDVYGEYMSLDEIKDHLCISKNTVRAIVESGEVRSYRFAERVLKVPTSDVEAYVQRCLQSHFSELARCDCKGDECVRRKGRGAKGGRRRGSKGPP